MPDVEQVVIKQLGMVEDETLKKSLLRKMAPPLVTLLSNESELQYVVLRNVSIIVHKYPEMLDLEVKVFFCKYNDPIYVKMVSSTCYSEGHSKIALCSDMTCQRTKCDRTSSLGSSGWGCTAFA